MHYAVANYSHVLSASDKRLDADYHAHPFRTKLPELNKKLNFSTLGAEVKLMGTGHTPYKHDVSIGNIPFITVECVGDLNFFYNKTKRITSEQFEAEFTKRRIQSGTVVCTIKRRICKAYPFFEYEKDMALNQDVALILPNKNLLPGYLAAYLNSSFGQGFADSLKTEQMNPYISLVNLAQLPIPMLNVKIQESIENLIKLAQSIQTQSETNFKEAQTILLAELGLANWKPKHRLSFVKNTSEVEKAGRVDAEYFQPKYEEIVKTVKSYVGGWDTLGNLVTMRKSVEIGSDEYLDEGIPFVRVSNLSPFELTEEKYMSETLYTELASHQPQKGEILLSKDGSPGIAYHLREKPEKMIVSGGILRLALKDKRLNPDYLTIVLNSMLVQEQVKRDIGGSIIAHWRPDEVKGTVIPILKENKQAKIQAKVSESFALHAKSKELLESAKRAVEMAIEEREEKAMKWLSNLLDHQKVTIKRRM